MPVPPEISPSGRSTAELGCGSCGNGFSKRTARQFSEVWKTASYPERTQFSRFSPSMTIPWTQIFPFSTVSANGHSMSFPTLQYESCGVVTQVRLVETLRQGSQVMKPEAGYHLLG